MNFDLTFPHYAKRMNQYILVIAVIGAGLTGISSAAHAIAHGFDVVIFEQKDDIGASIPHDR